MGDPMLGKASVFGAGVTAGVLLAASVSVPGQEGNRLPTEQLRRIAEIFGAIRANFAGAVDDRALADGCIAGFLRKQDPYYAYMDRAEFDHLMAKPDPRIGGLGMEVRSDQGRIKVISPLEGSPADRAGVLPGDVIVSLDDKDVSPMTLAAVVEAMRGEVGSAGR